MESGRGKKTTKRIGQAVAKKRRKKRKQEIIGEKRRSESKESNQTNTW